MTYIVSSGTLNPTIPYHTGVKIAEIGNFWYKFAQKGYTPLSDFYKIWLVAENPRLAPSYQISPFWL